MRIYFDTCCLMRAFDDQSYPRVRLETLAISDIMEYIQSRKVHWIASKALFLEVAACRIRGRREEVMDWLNDVDEWQDYTQDVDRLAKKFIKSGVNEWDARHLASAEAAACDWFLTTDQVLIKRAQRIVPKLSARVANPTEFILEDIP